MYVINVFKYIFYFTLLIICAYTDYKKGKIYNKSLIAFLLIYVTISLFAYIVFFLIKKENLQIQNTQMKKEIMGLLIGFIIGFVLYLLGVFKGGDAKLLAIVGLISGTDNIAFHFSTIIIVAGIMALCVLLKNKILINRFKRVFLYLKGIFLTMHYEKYKTEEDDRIKFPFAVYILVGEIISYIIIILRG